MAQICLFSKKQMQEMKVENPMGSGNPKKEKVNLTKKFEPSGFERDVFDFPLKKDALKKTLMKINEIEMKGSGYLTNSSVPQYILTTLSKYHSKDQSKLDVLDLYIFYKSIKMLFPGSLDNKEITHFSKANGLFFGKSQYLLMEEFLKDLGED